jgi:hypothetical protein
MQEKRIYEVSWKNAYSGTYKSFIVCARNEDEAKNYHPSGVLLVQATFNFKNPDWINPLKYEELDVVELEEHVPINHIPIGVIMYQMF